MHAVALDLCRRDHEVSPYLALVTWGRGEEPMKDRSEWMNEWTPLAWYSPDTSLRMCQFGISLIERGILPYSPAQHALYMYGVCVCVCVCVRQERTSERDAAMLNLITCRVCLQCFFLTPVNTVHLSAFFFTSVWMLCFYTFCILP